MRINRERLWTRLQSLGGVGSDPQGGHANGQRGVMTDYEAKFYAEGKNINRCVATMQPWEEPEEEDTSEEADETAE